MERRFIEQKRVVVTGIGLISPVGVGTEQTWNAILRGQSGIAGITLFDARNYACRIAGEVKDFKPEAFIDRKDIKKTSRFIQFGIAAAAMAVQHSQLAMTNEDPHRVGVHVGSGIGGFEVIEREHTRLMEGGPGRVSPFFITASIANLAAGQIAIRHGARGPNLTCSTACTTGAHDIGEAFRILQRGEADVMIAGAAEAAVTPLSIAGFAAMKALSTRNGDPERASRPWDINRDGFVTGEGAGIVVLETLEHAEARGAPILAELVGYAANADAFHTNAPPEDGSGIRRVMELALADAGIAPSDIDYLNAHATSTPLGDRAEATAIAEVFAENLSSLWVSSTKSMTGHLLGGAGSLEAGLSILALRDQIAPPMTNLETADPACRFKAIIGAARTMAMRYVMSNSFGFGGTNASLVFKQST
jgi:3-oxoacyl-[acyl-carrier-protein] synthase II